ncbi:MAG: hypothetical protein KDC45_15745 [Bacteroidetes bacterium]|nr:hypothetical protein [Bacteroidota bacterium]
MKSYPRLILVVLCFAFYGLTSYGGIRAPDAEVVFRVAQNLANGNGFGVSSDMESWPGFGVATGKDSVLYAVYPPGESVALVPFIFAARWINSSRWYDGFSLPLSHYVDAGLVKILNHTEDPNPEPHALRFICSLFNILITTLVVLTYYGLAFKMTQSVDATFITSLLFAFGTVFWNYANTLFSEPLAVLLVLVSFKGLVMADAAVGGKFNSQKSWVWILSGLSLGLAVNTHTLTILCAPFFLWYIVRMAGGDRKAPLLWSAGLLIGLAILGSFNWIRFGDAFETGRSLSLHNRVEWVTFGSVIFWRNFYGLFLGAGKGLVWFCPAAVLGLLLWRNLHRIQRTLALPLSLMTGTVIGVISAYNDWHAGFCLGPRYTMMIIPFLLLPVAFWWKNISTRTRWIALPVVIVCCVHQLYFNLGEIFSFDHIVKWTYLSKGIDVFINNRFYLEWRFSPLTSLLEFERGPFLLSFVPLTNKVLWLILSAVTGGVLFFIARVFVDQKKPPSNK